MCLIICHIVIDIHKDEFKRHLVLKVFFFEGFHHLLWLNLAAFLLGNILDDICKFSLHLLWQFVAIDGIHHKGNAALAGLAVDTNHRLIFSANVCRIDRKIRDFPIFISALLHRMYALIDGILMGSGKSGKYQFAGIRMTHIYMHLAASLIDLNDLLDILDLQFRIDTLGEHIVSNRQNIHITGTLAIAEQSTLNTVCTGKQC